jgi:hypothetical protein
MIRYDYLRNDFSVYLISGVALAVAVLSMLLLHKYTAYQNNRLELITRISLNKDKARNDIVRMDAWLKQLTDDPVLNVKEAHLDRSFFRRLDEIKERLKGASISITQFADKDGNKTLPLQLSVPVSSYAMLVDYMGYIESAALPAYKITHLSVSGDSKGEIVLNMEGDLRSPVTAEARPHE